MAPRRLSDRDKDQIVQLYQQKGMTLAMLAEQFGVSASTVGRVVRQGPSSAAGAVQEELLASEPTVEVPKSPGKGRPVRKVKGSQEAAPAVSEGDLGSAIAPPPPSPTSASPSPGVQLPSVEGRSSDGAIAAKRTRRRSRSRSDGEGEPMGQGGGGASEQAPAIAASEDDAPAPASDSPRTKPQRRSRSRSAEPADEALPPEPPTESSPPAPKTSPKTIIKASSKAAPAVPAPTPASGGSDRRRQAMADEVEDSYGDELEDETDLDLLEDGDDFDDDDDDDEGDLGHGLGIITRANATEPIEIYSLTAASIPNPCYLVVDRAANLVVRPLKDFQELGAIPDGEANCNTLPVFDNHRVARRFSGRTQRVIKVPDSSIFAKATPHLQEKDITRLLIDGQVYAL
ncbi:MAG: hypothetical protein Fur0042_17100 [Cyanophyceae cyanobacterium]